MKHKKPSFTATSAMPSQSNSKKRSGLLIVALVGVIIVTKTAKAGIDLTASHT